MTDQLDRIDLKLLRLLQKAMAGAQQCGAGAEKVAVSPATCHQSDAVAYSRKGYVRQVRAMVTPQKVDRGALAYGRCRARSLDAR